MNRQCIQMIQDEEDQLYLHVLWVVSAGCFIVRTHGALTMRLEVLHLMIGDKLRHLQGVEAMHRHT